MVWMSCLEKVCAKNDRFTDKNLSPEIIAISGGGSFGNPFINLCSGKGRFVNFWGNNPSSWMLYIFISAFAVNHAPLTE